MSIRNLVPWSYAASVAALCFALYAKANDSASPMTVFAIAVLLQFIFAAFAIYELRGSEQFTRREKSDWTVLILCAPLVFGSFYLVKLRRRIFFI
ncbi:MAG: hypothetical protein V4557_13635 [Bacteroidota bacterium]